MATVSLSLRSRTPGMTDVGILWQSAIEGYEKAAMIKIETLPKVNNIEEILVEVQAKKSVFEGYRHDGSSVDKFRSLVIKCLQPIERVGEIIGSAVSSSFPPSSTIFSAVLYLIRTANSVSADYNKVAGFFEDLDLYLSRLKILEGHIPLIPQLESALVAVLTSILVLCGICAKYMKIKRIVKTFRNLISGEDEELAAAYAHFHKMVNQEEGAVRNATLVAIGNLQLESAAVRADIRGNAVVSERLDQNLKALLANTEQSRMLSESRSIALEKSETLAKLSSLDFSVKHMDMFAKHHQGTGQWLLKNGVFQQWLSGIKVSTLWCPGIRKPSSSFPLISKVRTTSILTRYEAGAGKTVMISLVANHVREAVPRLSSAVVCIYCDYKDPRTHSEFALLGSIARQLVDQITSVPGIVKDFCDQITERKRHPTGDEWISLIESISQSFEKTYVFIDALDECPEIHRENFLYFIRKIEHLLRLFVTSRSNIDLVPKFTDVLRIDIIPSALDIESYVTNYISRNSRLSLLTARDTSLKQEIVSTVCQKAHGMFLLPFLQLDYLSRQINLRTIRSALKALPNKISDYYRDATKRIDDLQEEEQQLAKRAISYIFCARRPLNIEELQDILSVEPGDKDLDDSARPEPEILLHVSAGLIGIDQGSGSVGLIHYTLQDYLKDHHEILLPPNPEINLARACLTYLSFQGFNQGPCTDDQDLQKRLQMYRFSDYASRNWGSHSVGYQTQEGLADLLLEFLQDQRRLSSIIQILHISSRRGPKWHDRYPKQVGPMHVAAYEGLDKILAMLHNEDTIINSPDSYGETPLLLAAKRGHNSAAQFLIDKGANVNTENENGETALYWAARNGHNSMVEMLVKREANVLTKDNEGWNALDWAVLMGYDNMVKQLLDFGADIHDESDGKTKALYLAAGEGHALTLQMLLDASAKIDAQDHLGSSALDWAASAGREGAVKVLLRNGADAGLQDVYGNNVLHWAIHYESLTRLLLDHKVDVDAKNDLGQTPLGWAAQDGLLSVVEMLIGSDASVNAQDNFGFTALHRAALRGHRATANLLLQNGANPNIVDQDHWTPLHVAILKGHADLVDLLLHQVDDGEAIAAWEKSLDGNARALSQEAAEKKAEASTVLTGLRAAIQERQFGRSQLMLDQGADINEKDPGGWTALILAAGADDFEAVQFLLQQGADINVTGYDQRTALHWASERGYEEIVRLLVENGADVNARAFCWTAGLLAARRGHMPIVRFLIEEGTDINAKDYYERTILHWAAMHGDTTVIQTLARMGASLDVRDRWQRTILMWAIENRQEEAVQTLLDEGVDLEAKALYNISALHVASFIKHEPIILKLQAKGADPGAEALWVEHLGHEDFKTATVGPVFASLIALLREHFLKHQSSLQAAGGLNAQQLAAGDAYNTSDSSSIDS